MNPTTSKTTDLLTAVFATLAILVTPLATRAADYWWNGATGANYTSQNWESPENTPTAATPGGWDSIYNNKGGKVILTTSASPGYFRFASGELEIQTGGTLNPAGSGGGSIGSGATLTVNGGTWTGQGPIGPSATGAVANLQAGTWTKTGGDNFYARLGARINHTGGTLAVGTYTLVLGHQENWSHSNGDYYFGDADGSDGAITGTGNLVVGNITSKMSGSGYQRTTYGTYVGHGTVGLTGTLRNNGYVIADGYGVDRTLDMSNFSAVENTVDNNEYKLTGDNNFYYGQGGTGWFAVNGGKLVLPAISVGGGPGAYNWGESVADTDIDLVNSVRFDFADVATGGSMSVALLAPDRGELALTNGDLAGVWEIMAPGLAFTSTDLTFRYDNALAAALGLNEADLRLYHLVGNAWIDVTTGIDTDTKQIYAAGINSFSLFAVGANVGIIPEPSAGLLLAIGGLFAVRRRRQAVEKP